MRAHAEVRGEGGLVGDGATGAAIVGVAAVVLIRLLRMSGSAAAPAP
ncbi:hypothetical protein [Streptomyces sp. S465]|nr:hypothetical protein [Streptomyces sp. S465]WAP55916.1 hypothetical protein N6H00_13560 [Streptomyces sp. S465]